MSDDLLSQQEKQFFSAPISSYGHPLSLTTPPADRAAQEWATEHDNVTCFGCARVDHIGAMGGIDVAVQTTG